MLPRGRVHERQRRRRSPYLCSYQIVFPSSEHLTSLATILLSLIFPPLLQIIVSRPFAFFFVTHFPFLAFSYSDASFFWEFYWSHHDASSHWLIPSWSFFFSIWVGRASTQKMIDNPISPIGKKTGTHQLLSAVFPIHLNSPAPVPAV